MTPWLCRVRARGVPPRTGWARSGAGECSRGMGWRPWQLTRQPLLGGREGLRWKWKSRAMKAAQCLWSEPRQYWLSSTWKVFETIRGHQWGRRRPHCKALLKVSVLLLSRRDDPLFVVGRICWPPRPGGLSWHCQSRENGCCYKESEILLAIK